MAYSYNGKLLSIKKFKQLKICTFMKTQQKTQSQNLSMVIENRSVVAQGGEKLRVNDKRTFWYDGNILYLDLNDSFISQTYFKLYT